MKHKFAFFSLVLFSIILVGCGDDDDDSNVYKQDRFISGEVRMFTQSGEVKDKKVIKDFTERLRNFFNSDRAYSFDDDINVYDEFNAELIFDSRNNGILVGELYDDLEIESLEFSIKDNDGYSTISLNDTIEGPISNMNTKYKCDIDFLKKIAVPRSTGFRYWVSYLHPLFVKRVKGEIRFCFLSYMQKRCRNNEMVHASIASPINNLMDEEYLLDLKNVSDNVTDTIVFKESYVVFR